MYTPAPADRSTRDDGAALVMVLGIMMVGAVLLTTLIAVTLFNVQFTAHNREEMAVLASADSGIDIVLGELQDKTYGELSTVCGPDTYVINNDTVVVTYKYMVSGETNAVTCPSDTQIVTSLTVTSTATSAVVVATGESITRSVVATFAPTPPAVSLEKAIFSEASLTVNNNWEVLESSPGAEDADIYANGAVDLGQSGVDVDGDVYAAYGNVSAAGNATILGSLWANGRVVLNTNSKIMGDIYAASDAASTDQSSAAVVFDNGAHVYGSVLANGGVYLGNGAVEGIVFSRYNGVSFGQNSPSVGGSVYTQGTVALGKGTVGGDVISISGNVTQGGNGATVTGFVKAGGSIDTQVTSTAGVKLQNQSSLTFPVSPNINPGTINFEGWVGYPSKITSPGREEFPQLTMDAEDLQLWVNAGYTIDYAPSCTDNGTKSDKSNPAKYIDSNPAGIVGARLIIFACDSDQPVELRGATTGTVTVEQDTVLMSVTGFEQTNNISYEGTTDGEDLWTLYWIVPADAPGVDWSTTVDGQAVPDCSALPDGVGDIDTAAALKIKNLYWFVYTPCAYVAENGINYNGNSMPLTGQVYAGSISIATNGNFQMRSTYLPSLTDGSTDSSDPADVRLTARFDLRE
ncbi:polymer-forming cytoskeletal protein [Demequina salsinemoris]|uniref:polymer-forming cytoskeletal protein n=1 Tax=Demequina salsinemoris TaxID=577470 RepID=UPI0007849C54|nr:polymer-forming cytoskeletal protein [Demequina salsinemoris]